MHKAIPLVLGAAMVIHALDEHADSALVPNQPHTEIVVIHSAMATDAMIVVEASAA